MAIQVIWFKRDLRLKDHAPLHFASQNPLPTLLLYCFEPTLMNCKESDQRHWRFVYQSLLEINNQLKVYQSAVYTSVQEVKETFETLLNDYNIVRVLSYQETGLQITYQRDKTLAAFFKKKKINWIEFQNSGVKRGAKNRKLWTQHWYEYMNEPQFEIDLSKICFINPAQYQIKYPENIELVNKNFQPGGELSANQYLKSFLTGRVEKYNQSISKPLLSRTGCSRLSPYLAWGNLSTRQVYQATMQQLKESKYGWQLKNFAMRLRWRDHFIQKFEMEDRMEFENINRGFNTIRNEWNEEYFQAWAQGKTGYPLVDACMICLQATGYINFRMRAMLISFLTHHLWLDWKRGAEHLAQLFLDFEPGIHYAQIQMQSGVTGTNTIRIYNPVKQSLENDSDGVFIKQWIPALKNLPLAFAHEPWKMTALDQEIYNFRLGVDYPNPIVNVSTTYKKASEVLHVLKKNDFVQSEALRILNKHVVSDEDNG